MSWKSGRRSRGLVRGWRRQIVILDRADPLAVAPLDCLTGGVNHGTGPRAYELDTDQATAGAGLALLLLRANPDWIHRRAEQLEFVDTRAVRWRVRIDFFTPDTAPIVKVGAERFRLIPISALPKGKLPVVNQGTGE
jgi:hypothetical protein